MERRARKEPEELKIGIKEAAGSLAIVTFFVFCLFYIALLAFLGMAGLVFVRQFLGL